MSMLSAKMQAGFEPIAGYVLKEKLGSGGYGDVWSADAPGGLQKAIKIVHGSIDESRAASELKSLQRIRQVNHPFILSLERIEVVESQLIIVTELAQCSLLDQYVEYREKGFSGIARDRLLNYLKDAADGLDFLCQKHDLQHLDVKPGNLLLVSDRIKVADFGLVKDLQSNSQSLMGGLTPTYAAPEMFDGRPGRYSDQYSLAIVYQEMLTGSLPFRGRTTAQLANEHLHKAPALDELPAAERAIIAKALSKKPQQRFNDCKEMVQAIENAAMPVEPVEMSPIVQVRGWSPNLPKEKSWSLPSNSASRNSASVAPKSRTRAPGIHRNPVVANAIDRKDANGAPSEVSSESPSELIIAIGGLAVESVSVLRKQRSAPATFCEVPDRYLVLDTDSRSLEPLVDRNNPHRLDYGSVVHLPIRTPNYYREETKPFPQLSRRWVYNIPRSQLTEGVRPLGMLALLDHAALVFDRLQIALSDLMEQGGERSILRVKLIASLMGGTGSAMVAELGFMVRQAAETLGVNVHVELICTCASPSPTALGDLASASAMASLLEINHYFRTGGLHPSLPSIPESGIHRPPFDQVRVIYGGQLGNDADKADATREVAALLLSRPKTADSDSENTSDSSGCHWASTIRATIFPIDVFCDPKRSAATAILQSVVPWIVSMNNAIANIERSSGKHSTKQAEKNKFLVADLFRECNWNAQAWVCECMKSIVPTPQQPDGNDGTVPASDTEEVENLEKEFVDFLPLISEQLGIPIQDVAKGVRSLFEKSMSQLESTLKEKWLNSPNNWEAFSSLLESIQVQLKLNANSLFTVAKKLSEKHDELIEMVVATNEKNQELDAQLSKLAIESTFHVVAGRILVRIATQLDPFRVTWQQVSIKLRAVFSAYCEQLSTQVLGRSIDKFFEAKPSLQNHAFLKKGNAEITSLVMGEWAKSLFSFHAIKDTKIRSQDRNVYKMLDELVASLTATIETKRREQLGAIHDSTNVTSSFDSAPITSLSALTSGATSNQNLESAGKNSSDDPYDLDAKIAYGIPHLVDFGDQLKKTLIISSLSWSQIPEEFQTRIASQCDIQIRQVNVVPTLLCESNELNLEEMIDKVWMPTDETWQLVPRVLSRVDVEWIPFSLVSQQA
jgi:serine/threonine protein kinase